MLGFMETFSFQQLNNSRPSLRIFMNSSTWAQGKVPLVLQAVLWAGGRTALWLGWVHGDPCGPWNQRCPGKGCWELAPEELGHLRRRACSLWGLGAGQGALQLPGALLAAAPSGAGPGCVYGGVAALLICSPTGRLPPDFPSQLEVCGSLTILNPAHPMTLFLCGELVWRSRRGTPDISKP